MSTSYKKILKAVSLFTGVQGLSILLNLVRTKLAALILGPAGIGLNSIFNEMRELIHSTSNMGMDVSGVRTISMAYEASIPQPLSPEGEGGVVTPGTRNQKLETSITLTRSWVMLLAVFGALLCLALSEPLSLLTFSDYSHTWDYALLSPAVAFSTLTCGEMAVLKGVRKIKSLATVSILNVAAGLVTTIPIYYVWGMKGVVPALVVLTAAMFVIAACFSYREYPLHLCFRRSTLAKGMPMLVLGLSFVLSGLACHGSDIAVRTYINNTVSLHMVGLYSAGFTIIMTYGGMIFASLENDFFPRLSGIWSDPKGRQKAICQQTEVLLYIIIPLILVMIIVLPWAVPLLFSSEFNPVIPMTQIASVGLLFRAVYLPFGYVPLAAGDSRNYLALEVISYAFILIAVITGFQLYGLTGAGAGLVASHVLDATMAVAYAWCKYGIRPSRRIILMVAASTVIFAIVLALIFLM